MKIASSGLMGRTRKALGSIFLGPPMLAFLPALTLATYWMGGEIALVIAALGLPLIFAASGLFDSTTGAPQDHVTGLLLRDGFEMAVQDAFKSAQKKGQNSAVFIIEIDHFKDLEAEHGQQTSEDILATLGNRLRTAARNQDSIARIADNKVAICLAPMQHLDLELCIQIAGRYQTAIEEALPVDGMTIYLTCSIGFCTFRQTPDDSSEDWISGAFAALEEAKHNGPSGMRAYSNELLHRTKRRRNLHGEVVQALETGQFQAWFQPQINTDTGMVSGFEALVRWSHPVHGLIPPSTFLPALEDAGLMERLSEVMMYQSLSAVKAWDAAGVQVPQVGVNFAAEELRNPGLVERIRWDLERFGLTPDRLAIEVLETVVCDNPDDVIVRNIIALGQMGCQIDLDDFGTGHASIGAVRRFNVGRIKIDRSFVTKADRDPEQQKMISAILTMAERLDLDTLGEGVETAGEHALLAQLGCGHVQGYGIGRPMPFDQTLDWIIAHQAKLKEPPAIGGST
ncbi:putative bifunctional diguanylate cyclase/phosphodiesterase [Epibacterium ulvae]|uniref:Diguanylate cyclase/phosphodiesterase n=1 Tax=Epibacterium ulvae TaxID=1156985 RepID=A0A1G5RI91_9RHOB|nr:bifunctional diguanylate cyclase/phosphodiesterase [Epibacterium ulvae]SCZ73852.1 diguanylate cyclase/phosphodiesterase [Epibacterium ulvae]